MTLVGLAAIGFLALPVAPDTTRWAGVIELPGGQTLPFAVVLTDASDADSGTIDIAAQGVMGARLAKVDVSSERAVFTFDVPGAPASFEVSIEGDAATGTMTQRGVTLPVRLSRATEAEAGPRRPQHPTPPFPYLTEEVVFAMADGGRLAGTLSLPREGGPHPGVVLLTGSGAQDRDESLAGHKPFLVLADHLTRNGFAVLRCDDRGTGGSSAWAPHLTMEHFADDARTVLEFLAARTDIDASRVGFVGHSEGGIVGPMAVARGAPASFVVMLAGTGVTGAQVLREQITLILLANGMPEDEARRQADASSAFHRVMLSHPTEPDLRRAAVDLVRTQTGGVLPQDDPGFVAAVASAMELGRNPWFVHFVRFDPGEALEKVTVPVLALNGTKDLQVPPTNLAKISEALGRGGNRDVTTKELPGLNHLFQTSTTGSPAEYAMIEETFAPVALDELTAWLRVRAGLDEGR